MEDFLMKILGILLFWVPMIWAVVTGFKAGMREPNL